VIFVWCIPESPTFLISKGKIEEAKHSLAALGREGEINKMIKEIEIENQAKQLGQGDSFWKHYLSPSVVKPFLSCLGLMFFFQATGYNTILSYAALIFKESGSSIDKNVASGITGGVVLASAIVALALARVARRKTLLTICSFGTSLSLLLLGIYYYLKKIEDEEFTSSWSWVPLATMLTMIFFFMIGFGALAWTVSAEMLPRRVRGNLYPFIVAFTWLVNFTFAKSFVDMQLCMGTYGTFWLFSGLTMVGLIFIRFCIPETSESTPEEIALFFSSLKCSRASSQESVLSKSSLGDGHTEMIV